MPRLKPVDDASATGDAKELLETIRATNGSTPNMVRAMANSRALLKGYAELSNALANTLTRKLNARIAITIAEQNGCGYCLSAHTAGGRRAGLDTYELARGRLGDSTDRKIAAALAFARAVNTKRGGVDNDDLARLRAAGYDDAGIAAIVGHVALNILTNYFNRVAQPILDFPEVGPEVAQAA